ncbi:MAG TPA: hypothetical protein VFQ23_23360 [Anaerolineales bacterium]|nr:hypothetical protein [Anaerolineales bacterium]
MRFTPWFKQFFLVFCLLSISLAACIPTSGTAVSTSTPSPAPSLPLTGEPAATAAPIIGSGLRVAFVKERNIHLWDESTGQSQIIFNAGDVIAVKMSEDGQLIAFLRRSAVQLTEAEWREQSSLWIVDSNGDNPRELVSADALRQRLNAVERDSTNIPQLEWVPGTHKLLFSGWTYFVMAEGESHAVPQGLFLIDADSLTDAELVPAGNNLRFVPSLDGNQIALMSLNGLSFINTDGGNLRPNVLTYTQVGRTAPLFPTGVWTQDSTAFLVTGSLEADPEFNINFTIWRVPVDGSAQTSLATITKSDPRSVMFSPDGQRIAFIQPTDTNPPFSASWFIMALIGNASPIAIQPSFEVWSASLHWSPAGDPFTGTLKKLCPDASNDGNICDDRLYFDGALSAIHWIDSNRVLFLTRNPSVLFLATMDFTSPWDATTIPIVAWPLNESVSLNSFTTAK